MDRDRVPLADVTMRVVSELHILTDRLRNLEDGVETLLLAPGPSVSGDGIRMLQEIDVTRQSIDALADFLHDLCLTANCEGRVSLSDPLDRIQLKDLSARLRGERPIANPTGSMELF
ncbi:hypothetical protein [Pseudoponticoccus marisrubri]|uniref:Chemotaxis protein n=1 Tax=Pseudoponticoccus marisrubri TaxID=1685382 RepID=A0A0W7WQN3_9RHOB|nr:hypothetical protein [Pseudoponticoccus marisrubri]KUF12820.1 hypothetical protein AVJ23_03680 [Pseudoponticoccus marisrubri]